MIAESTPRSWSVFVPVLDAIRRQVAGRTWSGALGAAAAASGRRPLFALTVLLSFCALLAATTLLGLLGLEWAGYVSNGVEPLGVIAASAPYGVALAVGAWKLGAATGSGAPRGALRKGLHAPDKLIIRFDHAGNVLSVCGDSEAAFALGIGDLLGRGLLDRVHIGDRPSLLRAIDTALQRDDVLPVSLKLRTGLRFQGDRDFEEPVFVQAALRIRRCVGPADAGAACREAVAVCTTERAASDDPGGDRQDGADAEPERSWSDRLLANVSHELRTPLNAIIGFSEILGNADLAPRDAAKQREYAAIIHDSAEHLLSVVNMILDMSKIEAGRFAIAPESFDVAPLIASCCDMLRLKADEGGVALIQAPLDTPREIVADKRSFRQIMINLLSNAVKFTRPNGRVTVGAWVEGDSLVICVDDTGIGIAPGHFAKLGKPFFQARSSYDRMFEGTGLGLSLVRGLVGLHGGSLLLESVVAQGTRIAVRLPLDCRDKTPTDPKPAPIETLSSLTRPVPAALTAAGAFPLPRHAAKEKRIA